MAFNWSALESLVKNNPSLVSKLAAPFVQAIVDDPSIVTDAYVLSHGGDSLGTFVQKHQGVVKAVAGIALSAIADNPQIITDAVAAFSAPVPISASGGGA